MTKVIVATNIAYWNGTRGADQRILALLRFLVGEGHDVSVFFTGDTKVEQALAVVPVYTAAVFRARLSRLSQTGYRVLGWVRWVVESRRWRSMGASKFRTWYDFVNEVDRAAFFNLVRQIQPEVIVIEYLWLTRLVTKLPHAVRKRVRVVLDAHDVMHERTTAYLLHGRLVEQGATLEEEIAALKYFDMILAIQSADAKKFSGLVAKAEILTVPHAPAVRSLRSVEPSNRRVLFVGSASLPNVDGLAQFLDYVWPRLRSAVKDVSLDVVGTVCVSLKQRGIPAGVVLHGQVTDVARYYETATLVVAPLTYGSGLKVKVVEAIAFGRALVTTPVGAEGLNECAGKAFMVAEGWDEFARVCVEILEDPLKRLELLEHALRYADRHLSSEAAYREFGKFVARVGAPPRPSQSVASQ